MTNEKRSVVTWMIALFITGWVVFYGYFEARNFILGPSLTINSPQNGQTTDDSLVEITGQAKRIARIYLNDRQIFTRADGTFAESLILSVGYNIIEVKALDQVGRQVKKIIEIVLE